MNRDTKIGFCCAAGIHAIFLFGFSNMLLQPPQFGMVAGQSSVEVNLVAAPQEMAPAVLPQAHFEPPIRPPEPEDMVVPEKVVAENHAMDPAPMEKPVIKPKESQVRGDGSSPTPGRDQTTANSGRGATTSATADYLKNPPPVYPERARKQGQEGVVILRVAVDLEGQAQQVDTQVSSGFPMLDEAAVKAVRKWKFRPASMGGIPVATNVEVPVRFQIR